MLKILSRNCVRSTSIASKTVGNRFASNVSRGFVRKNVKKTLFFGGLSSIFLYDYVVNDFELAGGGARFLRSIKIAAAISADYTYSLWGLEDESEEYNQVSQQLSQIGLWNDKKNLHLCHLKFRS